jgi:hypothetical protein
MKTSLVMLTLAAILSTLAVGCMPSQTAYASLTPRTYPYIQTMLPDPGNDPVVHK